MKSLRKIALIISALLIFMIPTALADTTSNEIAEEQTNYNIISEEGRVKFQRFVEIKDNYEKICILEGILFVIVVIMTVKTKAIDTSTKSCLLVAVLGIAAYVFRFCVEGNIIYVLDTFLQILGVILILLSYWFIYKNENILIYAPVCACGIFYSVNNLELVKSNILCQAFLIVAPFVLYILGKIMQKTKEIEMLKPVKEKHERNK